MIYIGIDPGKKGGIASLANNRVVAVEMPLMPNGKEIDCVLVSQIFAIHKKTGEGIYCIIEKSQSMPKQSSTSTFNYGVGYGELRGILKSMKIPFEEVRPTKWK